MAKPVCPICEKPVGWRNGTYLLPDYHLCFGWCRKCEKAFRLLQEEEDRAVYHTSCLVDYLEARPSDSKSLVGVS